MQENTINPYEQHPEEYDQWFNRYPAIYLAELAALKKAIPQQGKGLEIGVGSGRFAEPLAIKNGLEPSREMAKIAEKRGIGVKTGYGEELPWQDEAFDFVLMVTVVCFFADTEKAFEEAYRVTRKGGKLIIGMLDYGSEIGQKYLQGSKSKFYQDAQFQKTEDIKSLLAKTGFSNFTFRQTFTHEETFRDYFENPENYDSDKPLEEPKEGYGKGAFVVISAEKCVM